MLLAAAAATLLLLPTAAAADPQIFLEDMSCSGVGALGEGLPAGADLRLTLVSRDNGTTLASRTVTASGRGEFHDRIAAKLDEVLGVRLVVATPDGRQVGYADHQMLPGHAMCSLSAGGALPYTGAPRRALAVGVLGTGLVTLGALLVAAFAYRGRRVPGR